MGMVARHQALELVMIAPIRTPDEYTRALMELSVLWGRPSTRSQHEDEKVDDLIRALDDYERKGLEGKC
jgi:hypothetical protein